MSDAENWMCIERAFDAPIDTVWRMWAEADMFQKWYGPMGFSVPSAEMDVRVGGLRKICMEMKTPERTMTMFFTGEYTEVTQPTRLVYTEAMCDADGTVLSPVDMGMPEGTPAMTEVSVDLIELDGKTRMTLVHKGVPAGSPGEGGWTQAVDKLAALLAA